MYQKVPPFLQKFIKNHLLKVEFICVTLLIAGYLANNFSIASLAATTMACFYFVLAFIVGEGDSILEIVLDRLPPIAWSICMIGIMFWMMKLPGYDAQLTFGVTGSLLALVLLVTDLIRKPGFTRQSALLRSVVFCTLCIPLLIYG